VETLIDQIAVVTGASSGIGKAIALELAAQRTRLYLLGRNIERLEAVAEEARTKTQWAKSCPIDLSSDKEIANFASQLAQEVERVDVLIHSAGVFESGGVDRAPVEAFDMQYQINVRAPYLLTQALLPNIKACHGQIVFINSSAGLTARANVGQYAATKHALKALADSLREEVNPDSVRVLSVYLGRTDSPMQQTVHQMEGRSYDPELLIRPEDIAAAVVNSLSLSHSAEVTEIYIRPLKKL
jgi:short-subunit dehydrogenase